MLQCTPKLDLPAIDAEIYELEQRLLILKRKRNSTSIIHRLPNDIFERILLLVQAQEHHNQVRYTDESGRSGFNKKWGRSMLICKRFREAALEIASLWAFIDATNQHQEWHDLCLKRAGTHELNLYGHALHRDDDVTKRTLGLLPRSSAVRIVTPDVDPIEPVTEGDITRCIDHLMNVYINQEQPILRHLELFNETRNEERYWCRIGSSFLGGVGTHLSHLLLDGCEIDEVPLFPSLSQLVLRTIRIRSDSYYLAGMLHKTPNLRFLSIHDPVINDIDPHTWPAGTPYFNTAYTSPPTLELLETLEISGGLDSIGRTVHILPIPRHKLDICVQDPHDEDTAILVGQPDSEISNLSFKIYTKAVQFMQQKQECMSPACHTIELSTCNDTQTVTRIVMSSDTLDYKTFGLSLRLVFSTELDLKNELNRLIRYSKTYVVPQHPGQLGFNEDLIKLNPHIPHLVIDNATSLMTVYPELHTNTAYIERIGRILSSRAEAGMSLPKMEFRFEGVCSDFLTPYYDGVHAYGKSLQDAQLVHEVACTFMG